MADQFAVDAMLVSFTHVLRDASLTVGSDDVIDFCRATAVLDPSDLVDIYWAGRSTLVHRRDHIPVYDRVFRDYFLDERAPADDARQVLQARAGREGVVQVPDTEQPGTERGDEQEVSLGYVASTAEVWRDKAFGSCSALELAAVRRLVAQLRIARPERITRRFRGDRRGRQLDARRIARETMRTHGEPPDLFWRRRHTRLRPLVLILDVSGSMADYSRNLLQFAYSTRRASARVEVFCFGTRLTRITRALERRTPDAAMAEAGRHVFDWDGGTRIGESLAEFVRVWGRRGTSRGAIVVICSDGLDRGDPAVLEQAMERLARLSYRIVWLNPHKGDAVDFRPNSLGMTVAMPFVDHVLSGHNLRSLETFAALLPTLR